ncbi:hypothetical protein [Rhodococcus sp. HNM0569]|uniref:hypothetical protein n=1 Tax=Rhodococcus sp. HNM0569 TaxID=2716340 RepID=UPI00146C3C35|nr:hypothetical protein [Rhodococcus sp. HNM0569]NLU83623.1 hypothetical protein [Rhodococcus sp. HNM0569]
MSTLNIAGFSVACLASLAIIVGSLGPWGVVQAPSSAAVSGTDTPDGKIILIAGCVAGASLLLRTAWNSILPLLIAALAGSLCAVGGITDLIRGQAMFDAEGQILGSVGWGLWLVCIGAVALLLGLALCVVTHLQSRKTAVRNRAAAPGTRRPVRSGSRYLDDDPQALKYAIVSLLCCVATVVLLAVAFSVQVS